MAKIHYHRKNFKADKSVAQGTRDGDAVVVVHGVDHNHNGKYDLGAGTPAVMSSSVHARRAGGSMRQGVRERRRSGTATLLAVWKSGRIGLG